MIAQCSASDVESGDSRSAMRKPRRCRNSHGSRLGFHRWQLSSR